MTKILMVCLGNICRSPVAEGIMRSKLQEFNLEGVLVDSAGTSNYHTGEHPDKRSTANAKKHGVDISKLVARQFNENDFEEFDHIFVMDESNYTDVISMAKNSHHKKKVRMILEVLHPDTRMPVPDPYFGGEQGFEDVFILLDQACETIAQQLAIELQK